ncbi:MAG: hypothetical protein IE916_01700 [Epsilonproteobacteria bacterium]|nr:hypothetical protein [Campylobacterota bacterium]
MRHISSLHGGVMLGSAGIVVMSILSGCEAPQEKEQNKFLVIEQLANGKYEVVESMPTDGPSRAIIRERDENGNITERFMNEEELKALAAQEVNKMESGESELNSAPSGEGMGLGGTILAAAAGALLGNMIGNALMNNKNYAAHKSAAQQSAYSRSSSPAKSAASSPDKKSYFNSTQNRTSTPSSSPSSYGS